MHWRLPACHSSGSRARRCRGCMQQCCSEWACCGRAPAAASPSLRAARPPARPPGGQPAACARIPNYRGDRSSLRAEAAQRPKARRLTVLSAVRPVAPAESLTRQTGFTQQTTTTTKKKKTPTSTTTGNGEQRKEAEWSDRELSGGLSISGDTREAAEFGARKGRALSEQ